MTRNKRELEKAVDNLDTGTDDDLGILVVYKHPKTGAYYNTDGEEIEPPEDSLLIVLSRTVVLKRSEAEERDVEILGPAENTNNSADYVRAVPSNKYPE